MKRRTDGLNYRFTEEEKKAFGADPVAYQKFRHGMEAELNSVHGVTMKGSDLQKGAVEAFAAQSTFRIATSTEALSSRPRSSQ